MNTKQKIITAGFLGQQAYKNGIKAFCHDKEAMKLIEGNEVGESLPIIKMWNTQWHLANLSQPN